MSAARTCATDAAHHCITCSDEGTPMVVLRVDAERGLALCEDEAGARQSVEIALVDAAPGDALLVHAGTALSRLEAAS
jgi:hydrogenase expression/formation protein HypC